jgi:flagellar biosynthetic protein FlhB
MVLIAIAAQALQVGWLFTLYPIQPNLSKLDPIKGLGRVFGKRGVVKTGANSLKLVVMLIIAAIIIRKDLDEIAGLPRLNMAAAMAMIGEMIYQLVKWLLALLLLLGIVDYFVQKHQHTQDLKMTKQEVRDERRSMEGDPEIKGRRLRMAREIAMQRINSAVPQADVIVTNPTHFSVAIKYDSESMRAPVVVAKGADDLAFRIRDLARTHGVPVVERPPLARALYHGIDVGREIDPEHYQAVAEVLAYVYRLDSKVQAFEEAMV